MGFDVFHLRVEHRDGVSMQAIRKVNWETLGREDWIKNKVLEVL